MDPLERLTDVGGARVQELDRARARHDHAHPDREPLDPAVVGQRRDLVAELLVAALERCPALERPAGARAQLQDLDLHRDDAGQ